MRVLTPVLMSAMHLRRFIEPGTRKSSRARPSPGLAIRQIGPRKAGPARIREPSKEVARRVRRKQRARS